jgi:hypothetical protein
MQVDVDEEQLQGMAEQGMEQLAVEQGMDWRSSTGQLSWRLSRGWRSTTGWRIGVSDGTEDGNARLDGGEEPATEKGMEDPAA